MRQQHMLKFITSLLLVVICSHGFSQTNDTISYTSPYGLRLGIDLSKPIMGMLDSNSKGIEFTADYRISKNWFVATEFGAQDETTLEDYTSSSVKGNFIKIGANYNAYQNWLDMNNEIFVGFRIAASNFDQTLKEYTINTGSDYFSSDTINANQTSTNLSAYWTEFVLGIKVETFKNLFLGFSCSYKVMINVTHPENFKTLYVPGFNRVFESETGFGFNYTLSYTIPFVNK